MKRVLHVVGGLSRGGTESVVMNLYRHIDRNKIQFDFVSHHPEMNDYEHEIKSLGGQVYYMPAFKGYNYLMYKQAWNEFFRTQCTNSILHSHAWSTAAIYLPIAQRAGIYTIAHSHSVSSGTGMSSVGREILRRPIRKIPDYYMACSKEAGEWLFGKKIVKGDRFSVIPNAIDINTYKYDPGARRNIRCLQEVEDKIVIGHVGSFNTNKNQSFIIDIFRIVHKINPQTVLWLIGDGLNRRKIERKCTDIVDSVRFWGVRNDIPQLLQAIDVFVFPSKHESFGSAAFEAMAAGVPTICSDRVPQEIDLSDRTLFLPLKNAEEWAHYILDLSSMGHKDVYHKIKGTKFDIAESALWLQAFYMRID